MKQLFCLVVILILVTHLIDSPLFAQVGINSNNSLPDNSAMLDVKSTDRGLLIPRMTTTSRNVIPSPATGLLIFNTSTSRFNYYNGSYWFQMESYPVYSTTGSLNPGGGVFASDA